jgi:CRISPR-associated exonuclease Cas4
VIGLLSLLAVVFFVCALLAARSARLAKGHAGLPKGRVIYSDTGRESQPSKTLVSRAYGLKGRPDYLIQVTEGIVPVEIKSSACPANGRPYDSHAMQLAGYCLLCEDAMSAHVPYGVIRYHDREVHVEYTPELRTRLLSLLDEIKRARATPIMHRNHSQARRCAGCGFREACVESLYF